MKNNKTISEDEYQKKKKEFTTLKRSLRKEIWNLIVLIVVGITYLIISYNKLVHDIDPSNFSALTLIILIIMLYNSPYKEKTNI